VSTGCGWSRLLPGQAGNIGAAYNILGNCCNRKNTGTGTILDAFSCYEVATCAQAFSLIGEELKKRLHAKNVYVSSVGTNSFAIHLQLSSTTSNKAVVNLSAAGSCNFPISCSWTRGARKSAGEESFQTLSDLMNYLVKNLRK